MTSKMNETLMRRKRFKLSTFESTNLNLEKRAYICKLRYVKVDIQQSNIVCLKPQYKNKNKSK